MQTVVITGGTSGIGLATADVFLKNGQKKECKLNDI